MKFFLLMFISVLTLHAEGRYSIQVISVHNKASITDKFVKKIQDSGFSYVQRYRDGNYRVFLGDFASRKMAVCHLDNVKKRIAEDAFLVKQNKTTSLTPIREHSQETKVANVDKHRKKVQTKTVQETKICENSSKSLRKAEIARALEFYKNSKYYKFK